MTVRFYFFGDLELKTKNNRKTDLAQKHAINVAVLVALLTRLITLPSALLVFWQYPGGVVN